MFDHINYTSFVDARRRMRFVADDQGLLLRVIELPTGTRVLKHLVPEVLKHCLKFSPLEVRRGRCGAELGKGLLMLGHGWYT